MKELRRRLPKVISPLEILDERIVPSAIVFTPPTRAALAEHSPIQERVRHRLRPRARLLATPGLPGGPLATTPVTPQKVARPGLRAVPTPAPAVAVVTSSPVSNDATPVTPSEGEVKNGPMNNAGQTLITIYKEFQQQQGSPTFTSSQAGIVRIEGTNVGIDAVSNGGDFTGFVAQLTSLGMQIERTDAATGTVEGLLPIGQLPNAAQLPQTLSLNAIYSPRLSRGPLGV